MSGVAAMKGYVVMGFSILALQLASSTAFAAEGPTSTIGSVSLDEARVSRYAEGTARDLAKDSVNKHKASMPGLKHSSSARAKSEQKQLRPAHVAKSIRADNFYFHDASSLLLTDRDADSYFSEFRVRFDADSYLGDVLVYARLYLRRLGHVDWELYHETDDFWVEGQSDSDDYYVTTTLDEGFATAEYEVLIDLYEVGYSDIVATIGPYDTGELSYLPLEEIELDVPIELPGYDIDEVTTTLLIDDDADGHYSQFRISFDPDANIDGNLVYAKVWLRAAGDTWIEEHTSEDFLVDASGEADVYSFTVDWISGYPTSFYDVQIDLYESASGLLVASAGSERPELAEIPLEDQSRDIRPNPPTLGSGGNASSSERGGGSFALLWLVLLLGLGVARERKIKE
jgi:hypothetical protein